MDKKKVVSALSGILSPDRVTRSPEAVSEFGEKAKVRAYPVNAGELQRVVLWAKEEGVPLTPSSSGPPHLSGASFPKKPSVIVDMARMNKILRVDRKNRVAMVEPGVRFGELVPALAAQGLRMAMPLFPRASKSVLASCLEREPTTLPKYQWDYMDPLCCLELVFGDGHLFRTGTAAGPGTLEQQWASGDAQVNNMGPTQADFGRLFQGAQGMLGIATWGSIRLEVKPEHHEMCFVAADSLEDLAQVQHWLLRLRLADEMFIANAAFFSRLVRAGLGKAAQNPAPWVLAFAVSGQGPLGAKQFAYRRADVADALSRQGKKQAGAFAGVSGKEMLSLMNRPSPEPFWKTRPRGAVREVFFMATLDKAAGFLSLVKEACAGAGVDYSQTGVYAQPLLGGRSCHLEFDFYFDPADQTEAGRVAALVDGLTDRLFSQGAFFSRPYGKQAAALWKKDPVTAAAIGKLKAIFDPAGILQPGQMAL